ncbi:MAG: DNA topoisomerase IB [Nocardioidaceae bacterium]
MPRLRNVSAAEPGFTRRRAGRGFVYLDSRGVQLGVAEVARIRSLVIPPAWKDVWICRHPNGHIQAVGTDAKGRRQYLYHPYWRVRRDALKHDHVLEVASRLPAARLRVREVLATPAVGLEHATATAFRLLDLGYFRIGSDTYASANGSYGLTTLRREHVRRRGAVLVFEFRAKSGVEQLIEIRDAVTIAAVEPMRRRRGGGEELLAYKEERIWRDLTAAHVNDYLKQLIGEDVSAKDFRTWHGTVHAAVALAQRPATTVTARKRTVAAAMREVATHLGNTPTVARASYVDDRVIERYYEGRDISAALRRAERKRDESARQQVVERALLTLLRS